MHTELMQMRKTLSGMLSSNAALKLAVREVNKMDMIRGSLVARNPKHQEIQIDKILDGELQKDVAVGDYVFIQNFCELTKLAYNNLEMRNSLDRGLLTSSYKILAEDPAGGLRRDNPVVYAFNHVPPDYADIDNRLVLLSRKIYIEDFGDDIIARAIYVHNSIVDIWPFHEFNGELAVFAMNYYLMEQGLMPIDMPMSKQDYEELIAACLKGRRTNEEYAFIKAAIYEKMAGTIEACRGYI